MSDYRDPTGMGGPHRWAVHYRVTIKGREVRRSMLVPARWRSDIREALIGAYGEDFLGAGYRRVWRDVTHGRGDQ